MLTALISILGDLFISILKRRRISKIRTIFPRAWWVLDRLDSLLAAVPLFYVGLLYYTHFISS